MLENGAMHTNGTSNGISSGTSNGTKRTLVKKPTSQWWVGPDQLKSVPPYLRDVPQSPTPTQCRITGKFPSWIEGSFIRIGAGRFTIPLSDNPKHVPAVMQHFFDGLAMLHKFDIADGKVIHRSRYTADGVARQAKKDGYVNTLLMFGSNANPPAEVVAAANAQLGDAQDPCQALLGRQQTVFVPRGHLEPDSINANVVPRRGYHINSDGNPLSKAGADKPEIEEIMVHTDNVWLQICDAKTLEPKRVLNFTAIDPDLEGVSSSAHPAKDAKAGEIFNYLVDKRGRLSMFCQDIKSNPAKVKWKTILPCPPCYVHSVGMTQKYALFITNPITMDMSDPSRAVADMLTYDPDEPVRFFVLDRKDGKHIATYRGPNFMFFHSVNCYDFIDPLTNVETIHVDLDAYDGKEENIVIYREYSLANVLDPLSPFMNGHLVRYELADISSPKAVASIETNTPAASYPRATVAQAIHDCFMELPRINKAVSCLPGYRYVYGCGGTGQPSPGTQVPIGRLGNGLKVVQCAFFSTIVKTDWLSGTSVKWAPPNGDSCPCEPVFIARPGATEEDDGVVLTIVCNRVGSTSLLVALDAKDLTEVARAEMPHVYGIGPHGTFVSGKEMFSDS